MRRSRLAVRAVHLVLLVALLMAGCGVGAGDGEGSGAPDTLLLAAGKSLAVRIPLPAEAVPDSAGASGVPGSRVLLHVRGRDVSLTAMLVPDAGASAEDRLATLTATSPDSVFTRQEPPLGDLAGFTAVLYSRDGTSFVERVWDTGGSELLALQASSAGETPGILLEVIGMTLRRASVCRLAEDERGVRLSDRSRADIVAEVNADVTPPPDLFHRLRVRVDPTDRVIAVTDTMTVDFSATPGDTALALILPSGCAGMEFSALRGTVDIRGDSALCTADSARVFQGFFGGSWDGFHSDSPDSLAGSGLQIRPTCSFQCGMWFYPGSDNPADYTLTIEVPGVGYSVYAPMPETSREGTDSLLAVTFGSEGAGLRGPLAWATGGFTTDRIAGNRSAFLSYETDTLAPQARELADRLATSVWDALGFEGARLDFIVVRSLDMPVLLIGPGCVFASSDILCSLEGYAGWPDLLASGSPVRPIAVAAGAARALLAESTWLASSLRASLSAWAVYRFVCDGGGGEGNPLLLEAFLKHYLFASRTTGGTEYALADPLLPGSPLAGPVLMGKGPVVIEFLHREMPAFGNALRRALGNLRHSGDSYGRLFSQMGLPDTGTYRELYDRWIYGPGIPVLRVYWKDSSGVLSVRLEQLQPGQPFPLGSTMQAVTASTPSGPVRVVMDEPDAAGWYTGTHASLNDGVIDIDIDPDRILPADIVTLREDAP